MVTRLPSRWVKRNLSRRHSYMTNGSSSQHASNNINVIYSIAVSTTVINTDVWISAKNVVPSPNYFCYACNLSWKFKKIKKLLTSFIRPSYNVTISVVKKGSKVGNFAPPLFSYTCASKTFSSYFFHLTAAKTFTENCRRNINYLYKHFRESWLLQDYTFETIVTTY